MGIELTQFEGKAMAAFFRDDLFRLSELVTGVGRIRDDMLFIERHDGFGEVAIPPVVYPRIKFIGSRDHPALSHALYFVLIYVEIVSAKDSGWPLSERQFEIKTRSGHAKI